MKNQLIHLVSRKLRFLLIALLFTLSVSSSFATHFRYGNLTWTRVPGSTNKIQFKMALVMRHSFFSTDPAYPFQVGTVVASNLFNPGFGANTVESFKVTAVDQAKDQIQAVWTKVVTYPTPGNYIASTPNFCCRINNPPLVNNPGNPSTTQHLLKTNVQVGAGFNNNNDAPVVTTPPVVNFPEHTHVVTYQFPAVDPNGDPMTFSLSPNGSFGNVSVQPAGLTISPSGLITWSTDTLNAGTYFYANVRTTDSKGAYCSTDFLIKIVSQSTPAGFDYTSSPPDGANIEIQPGDPISLQFKATDPDAGDTAKLSANGLPLGATFTTSGTNPVTGTFNWSPADTQQGTFLITVTSEDKAGVQTTTSFSVNVSYKPRFDVSQMPGNNSVYIIKPGDNLTHDIVVYHPTVTDGVNLTVTNAVSGMSFSPAFPVPTANPVKTTLSWTPTVTQWGLHKVVYNAADTFYKQKAYDTIFYIVDNPPFITSNPILYAYVGANYNYLLTTTDADIVNGDRVKVENITKPGFLSVTDNHDATFNIAGTPALSDVGTHSIAIEVSDSFNHFGGNHVLNAMQYYDLIVVAMPSLTGTATDVTINGQSTGAVNITVAGGVGPFTYSWSNNATTEDISGVPAGTYTVTVKDANGTTATGTFTVAQPAPLTVSGVVTNVTIYGLSNGIVDITPVGGVGPYTYSWSNSSITEDLNGVADGIYIVTVTDANGATATGIFTVSQPDPLTVTGITTNVTIYGMSNGAVNITPAGGVGPYTYSWNNSSATEDLNGVAAGTYTVTVTDANGATATGTFIVAQPAQLLISGVKTDVTIFGGSNGTITTTTIGGVSPYTYSWASSNVTTANRAGLVAGTYTITVTDANGATATTTLTVNQPAQLGITGVTTNVTTYGGSNGTITTTATGGVGPYTYSWIGGSATTANRTGLIAGTYTVTVTDVNGATATASFVITQPAASTFPIVSTCTFPYIITLESVNLINGKYEWIWSIRNPNPGNGKNNGTVQDLSHWDITLGSCAHFENIVSGATSSNGTSWSSFSPTYQQDPSIYNTASMSTGNVIKFSVTTTSTAKTYCKLVTTQNLVVNNQSVAYYKSGANTGSGTLCFPGFGCPILGAKGMNEQEQIAENISVYPNPNNGNFTINIPAINGNGQIVIRDVTGKIVQRISVDASELKQSVEVNLAEAHGLYIVEVVGSNFNYISRVVIQ
jgi:hypothetical protein